MPSSAPTPAATSAAVPATVSTTGPADPSMRVRQASKRGLYDRAALDAVLDAANVGHVAFVHDGLPQSIPTAIARIGDRLYLHGSTKSRLYLALASGVDVAVSVCLVDGLVKARSAFHCSMNYRSAVVLGRAVRVSDEDAVDLLDRFTEHLIPGSAGDYRPHLPKELRATMLVALPLDTFSVKVREGGPIDDEEDLGLPHWAGVLPLKVRMGIPVPAADLPADAPAPPRGTDA